jgi:hypothetical protein
MFSKLVLLLAAITQADAREHRYLRGPGSNSTVVISSTQNSNMSTALMIIPNKSVVKYNKKQKFNKNGMCLKPKIESDWSKKLVVTTNSSRDEL